MSFLSKPFELEVPLSLEECIERLDDSLNPKILFFRSPPKVSRLELMAIDKDTYKFSFLSLGRAGRISLNYSGELQRKKRHSTIIAGAARVPYLNLIVLVWMILLAIFLRNITVLGIVFFIFTIGWLWQIWNTRKHTAEILLKLLEIEE